MHEQPLNICIFTQFISIKTSCFFFIFTKSFFLYFKSCQLDSFFTSKNNIKKPVFPSPKHLSFIIHILFAWRTINHKQKAYSCSKSKLVTQKIRNTKLNILSLYNKIITDTVVGITYSRIHIPVNKPNN